MDGILVINKPPGLTSHDVVNRVRRITGQRHTGHAGTLDPLATGVLVVCLGQATRLAEYLVAGRKTYCAEIVLGVSTDTDDAEGRVTQVAPVTAVLDDVQAALDPNYPEVHEKQNAGKLGYGVCLEKFTGSRGKAGSSDARAEYVGELRGIFNAHNVAWQMTEIGKVDEGGGGTVAKYLAIYGMDIIDCGPPMLSMHSPFEVTSKADLFQAYKAYRAFLSTL